MHQLLDFIGHQKVVMPRIKNTIVHNGKRKVCRIFDTGPDGPCDRYTVAFRGYRINGHGMTYPYLESSDSPFHPIGVGQHGEGTYFLTGRHLGKRISFDSLPGDVQKFILESI